MRGLFISFEGPDGSGKSTQIRLINEYLINFGYNTLLTREPGGTEIGEKIRKIILDNNNTEMFDNTEMLLYAAARAQHVAEVIRPSVEKGTIVLCDRFVDSSIAYQGFGRELGIDTVMSVNNTAICGLMPDITFLFELEPEEGLSRSNKRSVSMDRLEQQDLSFHRRVREGFAYISERFKDRVIIIDASKSIDNVFDKIKNHINNIMDEFVIQ